MDARVALVTGASRGIGRATALALAARGFRVAVAARTLEEGRGRDDSDAWRGETVALPGSVATTVAEIEAAGGAALGVRIDLLDRTSLDDAVDRVRSEWGRLDVLVNNAVYLPTNTTPLAELTAEAAERALVANAVNPLHLVLCCLPVFAAQGGGTVINVTSPAGSADPTATAGQGGWGVTYGMAKAALNRIAGVVRAEFGDAGVRAFTLSVVATTERAAISREKQGFTNWSAPPSSWPASAIAWLADGGPEADALSGQLLDTDTLVRAQRLHAEWAQ